MVNFSPGFTIVLSMAVSYYPAFPPFRSTASGMRMLVPFRRRLNCKSHWTEDMGFGNDFQLLAIEPNAPSRRKAVCDFAYGLS